MRYKKAPLITALLGTLTIILAAFIWMGPRVKAQSELVIYDVHTNSPRIVKDDGSIEYADYVRIRNMTAGPRDLTGLYLSDSRKNYDKLPLEGVVIEGGSSAMIKLDPSWNFGLRRSGDENVYLFDSKGNVLFKYSGKMKPDAPKLSANSGFYDDEFELKISVKGNYRVYYTLDGCEPDEESNLYESPIRVYDRSDEPNSVINVVNTVKDYLDPSTEQPKEEPVDKAFIVRAVAIDEFGNKSDIVTREYFFCGDKYENIISVVADRDDLFGPYGIVSTGAEYDEWYLNGKEGDRPDENYEKKGIDWEIPVDMDYFKKGTKVLSQKCGMRLQGRTTRERRIKNFQLRARNRYSGSDVFEYDIFDNEEYRSDGIVLDDSFRESVFLSLIEDEDIIKQKTTGPTALFINGELWNTVYLRQRIDEKYFVDHYNIDPDNLVVMKESFPDIGSESDEETEELREYYLAIDELAENEDLSVADNYDRIREMMDIDSYLDYIAINTWGGCNDWAEYENDMYWRVKEPYDDKFGDGRFRWVIHDGDNMFNEDIQIEKRYFLEEGPLFRNLMDNEQFRSALADRLQKFGTTSFSKENVLKTLESDRWKDSDTGAIKEFLFQRNKRIEVLINDIKNHD